MGQVKKITRICVAKWGNFRPTVYIVPCRTKNHNSYEKIIAYDSHYDIHYDGELQRDADDYDKK